MNQEPLRPITDEEVARFWDDGAIALSGLYDHEWVERMRDAVEENLANPGPYSREYVKDGEKGRFLGDIGVWWIKSELKAYVMESPCATIAQRFLGSTKVNFFYDQLFVKEPGTQARTPWHQDQPYWPIRGWQVLSIWLALDDVTLETSGVEYIGSADQVFMGRVRARRLRLLGASRRQGPCLGKRRDTADEAFSCEPFGRWLGGRSAALQAL